MNRPFKRSLTREDRNQIRKHHESTTSGNWIVEQTSHYVSPEWFHQIGPIRPTQGGGYYSLIEAKIEDVKFIISMKENAHKLLDDLDKADEYIEVLESHKKHYENRVKHLEMALDDMIKNKK